MRIWEATNEQLPLGSWGEEDVELELERVRQVIEERSREGADLTYFEERDEALRLLRDAPVTVRVLKESRRRVDEGHVELVRAPMIVLDDREIDGVRTIVVREDPVGNLVDVQGPIACDWRDGDGWEVSWADREPLD